MADNVSPCDLPEITPSPAVSESQECCKFHPGAAIIEDYQAGVQICSDCSLVVGDCVIDVGSEWRTFSSESGGEDKSRAGVEKEDLASSDGQEYEPETSLPSPSYVPLSTYLPTQSLSLKTKPSTVHGTIPQKEIIVPVDSPAFVSTLPPSQSISSNNNEEKPQFSCKLCDASYGTVKGVKRHGKEKHNLPLVTVQHYSLSFKPTQKLVPMSVSPFLFTCELCDRNYKSKASIKRHVKEVHCLMNFKEEYCTRIENEISGSRKIKVAGAAKFITPRKPLEHSSVVGPQGHVPLHEPGVNLHLPTKPSFPMDTPARGQELLGHGWVGTDGGDCRAGEVPGEDQLDGGAGADNRDPPVPVQGPCLQHQATDQLDVGLFQAEGLDNNPSTEFITIQAKLYQRRKRLKRLQKLVFIKIWKIL